MSDWTIGPQWTLKPTGALRFVRRGGERVLQQEFSRLSLGRGTWEHVWEDVPVEEEEEGEDGQEAAVG